MELSSHKKSFSSSLKVVEALEARRLMSVTTPSDLRAVHARADERARANPDAEAARYGIDLNEGLPAGTISAAAKQPLSFNPELTDAARAHSTWMLANDVFAHEGVGGSDPGDRMEDAGYTFTGSWGWGENLAYRGSKPVSPEPTSTVAQSTPTCSSTSASRSAATASTR